MRLIKSYLRRWVNFWSKNITQNRGFEEGSIRNTIWMGYFRKQIEKMDNFTPTNFKFVIFTAIISALILFSQLNFSYFGWSKLELENIQILDESNRIKLHVSKDIKENPKWEELVSRHAFLTNEWDYL